MTATADETMLAGHRTEHALIWVRLEQLLRQPWFYYGTLFLLQLKRIWGMWQYRDLTSGDTSSYFADAFKWFRFGHTDIVWSPLYECFYGTLLHLTRDVATVTVLHRILIAFTATLLVLAVLRRLLPMELAWLIGAWWAVMPINFDTMYEVHLFAVIPILVAWLVLLRWRGPWARGTALGIFIIETILVRNETAVATGLFFLICVLWEWRGLDRLSVKPTGRAAAGRGVVYTAIAYLVPVTLAVASVGWVYHRSYLKGEEMRRVIRAKHTVNMGQVYAFGYEQRHPEWTDSPWTD
ncbi:MAG TPA: hypothetical protein VLJ39_10550, partial [Tepidisphaeraceae bacterium]|nr:hypothetical protein [Tepidisphaeraceae bacterium]